MCGLLHWWIHSYLGCSLGCSAVAHCRCAVHLVWCLCRGQCCLHCSIQVSILLHCIVSCCVDCCYSLCKAFMYTLHVKACALCDEHDTCAEKDSLPLVRALHELASLLRRLVKTFHGRQCTLCYVTTPVMIALHRLVCLPHVWMALDDRQGVWMLQMRRPREGDELAFLSSWLACMHAGGWWGSATE